MTRVEAIGLGRRYREHVALDEVSFELLEGAVTALVGANGAGKSTLIRRMLEMIHGSGVALFDGQRYSELARPAATVGVTFDAFHLDPRATVAGHLAMVGHRTGAGSADQRELLTQLGLAHVSSRRIKELSLGMRQRLTLAAALLAAPPVLILDEPANGLDPEGIEWLRELARSRARAGATVLLSSHQFSDVEACADRLLVLRSGQLVHDGPLDRFVGSASSGDLGLRCRRPRVALAGLHSAGLTDALLESDGLIRIPHGDAELVARVVLASGAGLEEIKPLSTGLREAYFALVDAEPSREGRHVAA